MKKTTLLAALAAMMFVACNSSVNEATMRADVHRLVAKTEQCYANVHNDLLDSLDVEYFETCNDELIKMMSDTEKKYKSESDRRRFDSLFMAEIAKSDLDNDLISTMMEIYTMDFSE
ncbi:MAG: hypothetical protein IIY87_00885 [Bacteroidales bacterium]|nr:hypothetical protein [Bacteroidales bacterium]